MHEKDSWNDLLNTQNPDIICLQETRCPYHRFPETLRKNKSYPYVHWSPGMDIRYSGVAILSKSPPISVKYGFEDYSFTDRCIIAKFKEFTIINVYAPYLGYPNHQNFDSRTKWEKQLRSCLNSFQPEDNIILVGDMNVAPQPLDVHPMEEGSNMPGGTQYERAAFQEVLELGLIDAFRLVHPSVTAYTSWPHGRNRRENNVGWRLDIFLVPNRRKHWIKDCGMYPKITGSDHCPIFLHLEIPDENVPIWIFQGVNYFLSNDYYTPIIINGTTYPSVTHAFIASKCNNETEREQIKRVSSMSALIELGKAITPQLSWEQNQYEILINCLEQKFNNQELKRQLLLTYPKSIIAGNLNHDNYFGTCLCPDHLLHNGTNILGKALMQVRRHLRASNQDMIAVTTRAQAKREEVEAKTVPSTSNSVPGSTINDMEAWKNKIIQAQSKDRLANNFKQALTQHPGKSQNFAVKDGILYKVNNDSLLIYVPESLRSEVLHNCHDSILGGHGGIDSTYDLISRTYWFPNLKTAVQNYVKKCDLCLKFKSKLTKSGLLQPISSTRPFEKMACDFLEIGRSKRGYCNCFVLVDLFSGYIYAVPTRRLQSADAVLALKQLLPYIVIPETLICDEGPHFISGEFKEFISQIGIPEMNIVPPDAHFSNGAAEAGIKKIVNKLKFYLQNKLDDWDLLLPTIMNTINKLKQYHGKSASEILYGVKGKAPGDLGAGEKSASAEEFHQEREQSRNETFTRKAEEKKKQEMQYNKHRRDEKFIAGEEVYVYFEPKSKFGMPAKFQPKFRRAQVVNQDSPVTYTVRIVDPPSTGRLRRVHVAFMKRQPT